jgi:hypothetical protein
MTLRIAWPLVLFFFLTVSVSANEIDDLKTASDVNQFLKKIDPKYADTLMLEEKATPAGEFGKNTFHKVDLDGNGQTDLIVESKYLFAVTDKNDLVMVDHGGFTFYRYALFKVEKVGGDTLLRVRPRKDTDLPQPPSEDELTLTFKFGGFIEYNSTPDHMKIESVTLSTSGCFGSCPIFTISIKADRSATYQAKQFNKQQGEFKGTIAPVDYDRLLGIINYMRLGSLKNEYAVPWTDDQGAKLTIKYDGGKVKQISDYGMIGTYGLENLYDRFFELRESQKWSKVR